jgi:hypothetical protein
MLCVKTIPAQYLPLSGPFIPIDFMGESNGGAAAGERGPPPRNPSNSRAGNGEK